MRAFAILSLGILLSCGAGVEDAPDTESHWHDRYVADHCARCPDCCVSDLDYPIDRKDEDKFCSVDVCPGPCCPCITGIDGLWWINYTSFGTDDGACTR